MTLRLHEGWNMPANEGFYQTFLMMECLFEMKKGFYCSHVFHNGPAGIAAGREIYGTPKVFADIRIGRAERTMSSETIHNGVRLLEIHSTLDKIGNMDVMPIPLGDLK
jgi:acetoacetate decarboxylase